MKLGDILTLTDGAKVQVVRMKEDHILVKDQQGAYYAFPDKFALILGNIGAKLKFDNEPKSE